MPNRHVKKLLQKEMTRKEFLWFGLLAFASIFGIAGVIRELISHGATPSTAAEPESGTVKSPATIVTSSAASGGKAVQFGSGTTAPTGATLFGDTPRAGGTGAAALNVVDAIYGKSKVARLFWPGAVGPSLITDRKIVGSFKTMGSDTAGWAKTMWRWTYVHEIDSKIAKGIAPNLASWTADMNSLVKLNIPGLSVILTADCFTNPRKDPTDYLVPGITHFGIDFDGAAPSSTIYHDYSKELAAVVSFAKAHNLTWGIPEFSSDRASWDPSGSAHAAWIDKWAKQFAAAGAEYVCIWEYDGQPGSVLSAAPEIAEVSKLLAS